MGVSSEGSTASLSEAPFSARACSIWSATPQRSRSSISMARLRAAASSCSTRNSLRRISPRSARSRFRATISSRARTGASEKADFYVWPKNAPVSGAQALAARALRRETARLLAEAAPAGPGCSRAASSLRPGAARQDLPPCGARLGLTGTGRPDRRVRSADFPSAAAPSARLCASGASSLAAFGSSGRLSLGGRAAGAAPRRAARPSPCRLCSRRARRHRRDVRRRGGRGSQRTSNPRKCASRPVCVGLDAIRPWVAPRSDLRMSSSTSTKLVVCGVSVCGRVLHTRGVTCSAPNCTVSSIATSKLMMRPVVLSRPAKIAVGCRIGSARSRRPQKNAHAPTAAGARDKGNFIRSPQRFSARLKQQAGDQNRQERRFQGDAPLSLRAARPA